METTTKFIYGDQEIEFELTDTSVMVNATEMAKVIGKDVTGFTRNDQTAAFLKECCKDENFFELAGVQTANSQFESNEEREKYFLKTIRGGRNNGTWLHRVLALKFAAWLNPAFELWVYKTIDKLLFGQYTEIDESIKKEAKIDGRLAVLNQAIESSEVFIEIKQLKAQKENEARIRAKHIKSRIKGQTNMFN